MHVRLAALIVGISLMVSLLTWTAHSSWQRTHEMHQRLSLVQSESFHQLDHFQQAILDLNSILLRYQIRNDPATWREFLKASEELTQWITTQAPHWSSEEERMVLDQLNTAFQDFMVAAKQIDRRPAPPTPSDAPLVEFAHFEGASRSLLQLGYQLANAHRKSLAVFLAQSDRSLSHVQILLLGSLTLLLVFAAGLAAVLYRDMIAPLRLKLVESRELADRHEKLASLGMLAAGVAHEIRNPLTAIKARLFILLKFLKPDTTERANATFIGQEITRLERILSDFLLFARPSEPVLRAHPADQLLRDVHALLALQLEKNNIRLLMDDSGSACVNVDPQQIQQVLINLVQNAADSIGRDGSVVLRIRLDRKRLREQIKPVVILEVTDTGKGIPPEVQKKLFDPFFTTKEGGTGLGLSLAARIVEKHGGALQYKTQVNAGTAFGIVLPRLEVVVPNP